jgi:LacI family transcriptional regulator
VSVTQKELARELGLSPSSISRALANDPHISAETRARVREAAERLGYRPNLLAASFRTGNTHTIGLIVTDITYPFYSGLARAVEDYAYEQGYNVILCDSDGTLERENLYLEVLQSKRVDGILMTPISEEIGSRQALIDHGTPYVLVDVTQSLDAVSTVGFDHSKGMYLAVRHLIECGHARVGLALGNLKTPQFALMYAGYKLAMDEAGIKPDPAWVCQLTLQQQLRSEGASLALERLLHLTNPPTAVVFSSDAAAVAAMRILAAQGKRVPDDLAIIGYDDTPLGAAVTPAVTTIAQDEYEMGRISARILLSEIEAGPDCTHQTVILQPRLVVRPSTCDRGGISCEVDGQ